MVYLYYLFVVSLSKFSFLVTELVKKHQIQCEFNWHNLTCASTATSTQPINFVVGTCALSG